ncbi:C2H2 type zinc-finger-domain-containing protein [Biscogniauxia mediterranea]|nr:C2H2 type zinc-finger-domain-containing protein [Biscogniauxia mediterranea]
MLVTPTATTTTTTAPLPTLPMSLSPSPETNSTLTSFKESVDSPDATMQPFTPGQCLFCPNSSTSFTDSVIHMRKSHGLFVPHQQHLLVDLETLFGYLHLIIFGYRECIQCGTERATVQAVQQHMTGKGHCTLNDISDPDSEFADFYDFSELEDDDAGGDSEGDGYKRIREQTSTSSRRKLILAADEDSIRLPSGKIISRKSSAPAGLSLSLTQPRRRTPNLASQQLEYYSVIVESEEKEEEAGSGKDVLGAEDVRDTRSLLLSSKREKRERAAVTYQMAQNMSANDRSSLVHLPASQQRSILAAQLRHADRAQKEERRRQSRVDRKGNKNLYAYWHTETPVYQCG